MKRTFHKEKTVDIDAKKFKKSDLTNYSLLILVNVRLYRTCVCFVKEGKRGDKKLESQLAKQRQ